MYERIYYIRRYSYSHKILKNLSNCEWTLSEAENKFLNRGYIYIYICKKIMNNECAILFNKTCINERLLPKYIYMLEPDSN